MVAATLRELRPDVWKISLRGVDTFADCNRICGRMGGGGHPAAAGATLTGDERTVRRQVYEAIYAELRS